MPTNVHHYQFIHNCFGDFYRDILNWFGDTLYPRFQEKVIGTYDKAIQYLEQKAALNREMDTPILPMVALNPVGEINAAEGLGKSFWRYPNLGAGLGSKLFNPLYRDNNLMINVVFARFTGEIELLMFFRSIYEYLDMRVLMLQTFGGYERRIYPSTFSTFLILPTEVYTYNYSNEYTGANYQLDWTRYGVEQELVKSTNTNEYIYPCRIKPIFYLQSMSDASARYGGTDKLAEYKLSSTLIYEIEMPVYIAVNTNYLVRSIYFNIRFGSTYSAYPEESPPENIESWRTKWLSSDDSTANIMWKHHLEFNTRYYHVVTESEADSTADITFDLPVQVANKELLYVNSSDGQLNYGDHYRLINGGRKITIKVDRVTLVKDMIIELYYYKFIT